MQFGYTILYVPDVAATVRFYEQAFGLKLRFADPAGQYAEMDTGAVALAFAQEAMAKEHGLTIVPNRPANPAAGVEIALVSADVGAAYHRAVQSGAAPIKAPTVKPWGQTVGYVRDNNGVLVELCDPAPPPPTPA
jgi:predicted enzyme related to lactoylglutathione lyase